VQQQRRGRGIAMSAGELTSFLGDRRTCLRDMIHDGRHAWLRITPAKIVSWDFRKLATLPARPLPDPGG